MIERNTSNLFMFKKVAHCVTREWKFVDIKDYFDNFTGKHPELS